MNKVIQHIHRIALLQAASDQTDGQLLESFVRRREEAALEALVRRHGPMVWGVCGRILHNHHDAEDAFQATFLVLVRKAATVKPREMVGNWLYGVAHQTALKARATRAKRQTRERQVADVPEPAATEPGLWSDLQPVLDQELSRLPDKYRVAIVLCDLEGKTRKEAARQLGCPEGTMAGRLTRARIMLAKRLTGRGVALSGSALAVLSQQAASAAVPASVVVSTIKAASLLAAGKAAATGVISVKVAALTDGVLKTMLLTKLKIATAVFFVATAALTCGVLAGQQQPGLPGDVRAKPEIRAAEPPKEDKDKKGEAKAEAVPKPLADDSLEKILVCPFTRFANQFARLKADHSGLTLIGAELSSGEHIMQARIAPDGKSVAFQHPSRAKKALVLEVWQFDQPWPGKVLLTGPPIIDFFWMPDGKHLVLCGQELPKDSVPSDSKFKLLDVSSLKVVDLKLPEGHWPADVSPDGKWFLTVKIVDLKNDKSGAELYRVEVPTGKVERLFDKVTNIMPPRWHISPDGAQVAGVQRDDDGKIQAFVGDLSGGPLRQVTREATGVNRFSGWSPSGKNLLYGVSKVPANPKGGEAFHEFIVAIDADGQNRKELYDHERHFNAEGQQTAEDLLSLFDWR